MEVFKTWDSSVAFATSSYFNARVMGEKKEVTLCTHKEKKMDDREKALKMIAPIMPNAWEIMCST